jgi:hypothetical protein
MTTSELNRDIKRLLKEDRLYTDTSKEVHLENLRREFLRLERADRNFEYINRTSILIMLSLNLKHRFVALHTFGLFIDLSKL